MTAEERVAVILEHGANESEVDELLRYTEPKFDFARVPDKQFPLDDEPFVATWSSYVAEAKQRGAWSCLREKLVQLRFPIAEGMSRSSAYRAATRLGDLAGAPDPCRGLCLRAPDRLRILMHHTPAGRIPILVAEEREDFVALVRALVHRNQPHPIPEAQGACVVGGYNNWNRVHRLRDQWRSCHPHATDAEWRAEFGKLVSRKDLYQDRFIVLSAGPYSGVPAIDMGMSESAWKSLSFRIRLEHECVHYFTRRVLGSMSNSLQDELMADYVGITLALGSFRAEWFLRFMGVEHDGTLRPTGRLNAYRGTPLLSDGAFRALRRLVRSAAYGLEALNPLANQPRPDQQALGGGILALASETVESLALLGQERGKQNE